MSGPAGALDLFLAGTPGLEDVLAAEARSLGLDGVEAVPGGVTARGGWPDVWRANLGSRCASRVLVRVGSFRAQHLSQLDKKARALPWDTLIVPGTPVRVEAVCKRSKIYHSGAAAERVTKAVVAAGGMPAGEGDNPLRVMVRIENDQCTVSLDTSGELLHRRGFKQAVAKAPMRETLAASFLMACGYAGDEPVFDPMCGSGTFVVEAAEKALGLLPGRERRFAFERLAGFDAAAFAAMREASAQPADTPLTFTGADRNAAAVRASQANAARAGLADSTRFIRAPLSEARPPEGPPGLVIVNPPYGARIGDKAALTALYRSFGAVMRERFAGWRVGLVTSDDRLAKATKLDWDRPGPPVPHGSLKVRLYQAAIPGGQS